MKNELASLPDGPSKWGFISNLAFSSSSELVVSSRPSQVSEPLLGAFGKKQRELKTESLTF